MPQPMLLRGRHRERFTVVPRPRLLGSIMKSIIAHRDIAMSILGAQRQIKSIVKVRQRGLEQAAPFWIRDFRPGFPDQEITAVERAAHAAYRPRLPFDAESEAHHDVSIWQHHALPA